MRTVKPCATSSPAPTWCAGMRARPERGPSRSRSTFLRDELPLQRGEAHHGLVTEGELRADRSGGERRFDGLEPGVDTALLRRGGLPHGRLRGRALRRSHGGRRSVACSSTSRSAAAGSRARSLVTTLARPSASPTAMHSRPRAHQAAGVLGLELHDLEEGLLGLLVLAALGLDRGQVAPGGGQLRLEPDHLAERDRASSMRPAARYKAARLNHALA